MAEGHTKVNITLSGSQSTTSMYRLNYQVGEEAFLGVYLMVPAGYALTWRTGHFVCRTKSELNWKVGDHSMGRRYNELLQMRSTWRSWWVTP